MPPLVPVLTLVVSARTHSRFFGCCRDDIRCCVYLDAVQLSLVRNVFKDWKKQPVMDTANDANHSMLKTFFPSKQTWKLTSFKVPSLLTRDDSLNLFFLRYKVICDNLLDGDCNEVAASFKISVADLNPTFLRSVNLQIASLGSEESTVLVLSSEQ